LITDPLYGNYRARVIDNKDPSKYGRVKVWIPDIMPEVSEDKGLWARPANNPIGGRNEETEDENHYMGSSYIPRKGAWVFVFFEKGDIASPYYFGALDLENTTVLPENQLGNNYEDKWTILKTHEGRCMIISDDPSDARMELTGKKRNLSNPPTGDTGSVYTIDGNMTTILLDERSGKEKILIRTHKGDYVNINTETRELHAQFNGDIRIKTSASMFLEAGEDINIKADGKCYITSSDEMNIYSIDNMYISADGEMNITSGDVFKIDSADSLNLKASSDMNREAGSNINDMAASNINSDGAMINDQSGAAGPAQAATSAQEASPADPNGDRK